MLYLFQTCRIFLLQKAKIIGKTAQELAPCSLLLLLIQNYYDTFSIIWYMKHADEGQITNSHKITQLMFQVLALHHHLLQRTWNTSLINFFEVAILLLPTHLPLREHLTCTGMRNFSLRGQLDITRVSVTINTLLTRGSQLYSHCHFPHGTKWNDWHVSSWLATSNT